MFVCTNVCMCVDSTRWNSSFLFCIGPLHWALVIFSLSVNATVNVGGVYNFSCNASNYLQLQWIFHDPNNSFPRVVSNTTDGRRVITPGNEIRLSNIQFEDEGMLECRLRNMLGIMSLWNNLTVVGQERFAHNSIWKEMSITISLVYQ